MNEKDQKLKEIIRELAANFFSIESNRQSMITVTDVEILSKGGKAKVLITVLPESEEDRVMEFAKRRLADLREYVRNNSRIARVPFFDISIDKGEKNRQLIDELGKNI